MIINYDELDKYNFKNNFLDLEELKKNIKFNPFANCLIYLDNKKNILGYLYYSDIYERAEINQIEVNVINRNCGIASKMMDKMIKTVEKDITLEVKINNYPAISLYEKFNFKKKAIRKGYYEGVDGILMERKNNI